MAYYVNTKVMAQILEMGERRIQQLSKDGIISREPDGTFDAMKVVIEYYKNKNGIDGSTNYDNEHALLEKAKRETAEIELAELKGEIHKAEDIKVVLSGMIITCRNKLLTIPATVAVRLIGQKNPNVVIDILTKEIKIALNELAEYDVSLFASDSNGR